MNGYLRRCLRVVVLFDHRLLNVTVWNEARNFLEGIIVDVSLMRMDLVNGTDSVWIHTGGIQIRDGIVERRYRRL